MAYVHDSRKWQISVRSWWKQNRLVSLNFRVPWTLFIHTIVWSRCTQENRTWAGHCRIHFSRSSRGLWPQGLLWVFHSMHLGNKPSPLPAFFFFLANQSLWTSGFSLRFIFIIFKLCVSVDEYHLGGNDLGGKVYDFSTVCMDLGNDDKNRDKYLVKIAPLPLEQQDRAQWVTKKKCWFGNMQIRIL